MPYNERMMHYSQLQGAIFDVDDTLLSNHPGGAVHGLHELSRLAAAHEVGRRHDNPGLQAFTLEQCTQAFRDAKVHTLQAAVWQTLIMTGEVPDTDIDPAHPLLNEMMTLKDELHEVVLRERGEEVPGATAFVRQLAVAGLEGKIAIASTACHRDIDIFLAMSGLDVLFPDDKIISRERFTHGKPHPEAFNLAFAALHLPESARPNVVAFEDDPRGVMSAKAAGLFTCGITTRFSREELGALSVPPDLIADSYQEFAELFGMTTPTALPPK
jgi:beta-phosphoglucomutase-like phosphatase (HAD superfamily)